jgi:hypothetical protein
MSKETARPQKRKRKQNEKEAASEWPEPEPAPAAETEAPEGADSPPLSVCRCVTHRGEVIFHVLLSDGRIEQMKKDDLIATAPNVYLDYMEHLYLHRLC